MKKSYLLAIALTVFAMASCVKPEKPIEGPIEEPERPTVEMTFTASIDDATKAYIDNKKVFWAANDKVAVYDGVCDKAHEFTVKSGAGTTSAELIGSVHEGATSFVAVCPASAAKGFADGKLTLTVPSVQTVSADNIDQSALLMVSKADDTRFSFHNVNGVIKVNVNVDGLTRIVIKSNNGKAFAGEATVNPENGVVVSTSGVSSQLILKPNGATFEQGIYYIPALPVDADNGITLYAFTTTDGRAYAEKWNNRLNLTRNKIINIGGFNDLTPKDNISLVTCAEQTSSTLTFGFDITGGARRLALYEDEACTKLVVAHNIPAGKIDIVDQTGRFVFGGLQQNTNYYLKVTYDELGFTSAVVPGKTEPFIVKQVPSSAQAGDVVLAEDFGELATHGTYNNINAASWTPFTGTGRQSDFRFAAPSGEQTQYYVNYGEESRLFCQLRDAVPYSRLADWAEWIEIWSNGNTGSVSPHAGHLKIGANSILGRIVTPEMKFVPDGKTATLKVTFTGARLDTDNPVVQVVTGSKIQAGSGDLVDPYNFVMTSVLDEQPVEVSLNEWGSYKVTVSNVTKDSRIAIGTKRAHANNQRFIISDVKIELVSYETPAAWPSGWSDITTSYSAENNVALGNIKMYKNTSLEGRAGNVGYAFKVPAGQLDATVVSKYNSKLDGKYAKDKKAITNTMKVYDGYTIYIPYQGPQVWDTNGDSTWEYYSPLIYGPNATDETIVLRGKVGFDDGKYKAYSPALGIRAGKAYIEPASTYDQGNIYMYSDITPSGEAEWNVDACISGMFQIVKDGKSLIAGPDDGSLNAYNQSWRKYPGMTQNLTPSGTSMLDYDKLRTGRVVIGCTAQGDLIILAVEKFVNTKNVGQGADAGHNGGADDSRGLTMYETAKVMTELGCSDAMTIDDLPWSFVVLNNNTERGKDLFWNYQRCNADGSLKSIDSEYANLWTLCVKANNNVGDLNRNTITW